MGSQLLTLGSFRASTNGEESRDDSSCLPFRGGPGQIVPQTESTLIPDQTASLNTPSATLSPRVFHDPGWFRHGRYNAVQQSECWALTSASHHCNPEK